LTRITRITARIARDHLARRDRGRKGPLVQVASVASGTHIVACRNLGLVGQRVALPPGSQPYGDSDYARNDEARAALSGRRKRNSMSGSTWPSDRTHNRSTPTGASWCEPTALPAWSHAGSRRTGALPTLCLDVRTAGVEGIETSIAALDEVAMAGAASLLAAASDDGQLSRGSGGCDHLVAGVLAAAAAGPAAGVAGGHGLFVRTPEPAETTSWTSFPGASPLP
jgi:hypothetical protein